jgi:tetratricopeptide (TPR) repeat protein
MKLKFISFVFIVGCLIPNLVGNDSNFVKTLLLPEDLKSKYYSSVSSIERVNALNDICFYLNNVEPEKAEQLARMTLRISDSVNYLLGLYDANNNIGISFYRTSKYQQAISCFKQAEEYARILGDKGKQAAVLSNMALVFTELCDYDRALMLNNKALKIRSLKNDSAAMAISFNNLGMCYHQKGDYSEALKYYFMALGIKLRQFDKNGIANSSNNIGQLFLEMYSDTTKWALDSAQVYFLQAYNFYSSTSNQVGLSKVLLNIANVYAEGDDNEKALNAYRAALNAQKFINDSAGISLTYYNMALRYNVQSDYAMEENFLLKSLAIADRFDLSDLKKDNLKQLFLLFNKKGDFKTACMYAERLVVVNESIEELSRISLVDQYNGKYEYQMFENMSLQKDISTIKFWLIIVTVIALTLTSVIIVWYFIYKK